MDEINRAVEGLVKRRFRRSSIMRWRLPAISITAPALFYLPTSMSVACSFSIAIPAKRLTFSLQIQKVSKKSLSPNYALNPIIFDI
tara:strand:+ start:5510 stop:5767 length:258 start_codon:yes stop_codon:yes gene_type:complete